MEINIQGEGGTFAAVGRSGRAGLRGGLQRGCDEGTVTGMKQIDDVEFGRRFRAAVARAAVEGEEIVVTHRSRKVARIIPEPVRQTACEAMADLGRTLGAEACAAWSQQIAGTRRRAGKSRQGTLSELRNPWAS